MPQGQENTDCQDLTQRGGLLQVTRIAVVAVLFVFSRVALVVEHQPARFAFEPGHPVSLGAGNHIYPRSGQQ
jgi:hypothetical protein